MTAHTVHLGRLESVPLAVIRRLAKAPQLSRIVPECCGIVWNVVRAQKARAGRNDLAGTAAPPYRTGTSK